MVNTVSRGAESNLLSDWHKRGERLFLVLSNVLWSKKSLCFSMQKEQGNRETSPRNFLYYWGFLFLLTILYYTIISLTPYFSDDWHYCMMIGEENRRIENVHDVFVSNYHHYFQVNGRFIPHFFLMLFDALFDKSFFNLFAAVLFGLYLHLLNLNFVHEREYALWGLALSAFLTVCVMCGFSLEFLWMSGVFNYEFVAVIVLFFHYLLNRSVHSKAWIPLLFLYGIVAGWTHEAVVIGLCFVYLFMYAKCWRTLKWSQWVLLFGFVVGVALCVFSPGSIHRALGNDSTEVMAVASVFSAYLQSLFHMHNLRVFFIMIVLCLFLKQIKWDWLIGVIVSVLFVTFTGHQSGQSRFGIELFSLIIILRVFPYGRFSRYMDKILMLVTIIYMLFCIPYCLQNYRDFLNAEKQIQTTRDGIIVTNEVYPPFGAERLIVPFFFSERSYYYFVYDDWYNPMLARYYGRDDVKLMILPKAFVDDARKGLIHENFDMQANYPFYVCRWDRGSYPSEVKYLLKKSRWASFPILNKMERFIAEEVPVNNMLSVEIDGLKYLLLKKKSMVEERIKGIKYE